MDKNLYSATSGPVTIQSVQPVITAFGEIIFAGTKWNSNATYEHCEPPDYMRPTAHYLMVYTLEGEADYYDSTGVRTILRKGSLVWTAPGVNQSYGPRKDSKWSEFYVWFSGSIFDTWNKKGYPGDKSIVMQLLPVDYWLGQFKDIVAPESDRTQESNLVRLCKFQLLIAKALEFQNKSVSNEADKLWLAKAMEYLNTAKLSEGALKSCARKMNISYSLFRQRFTILAGKAPGQFRTEALMNEACRMLIESDRSIGCIAEELCFHDQFHFSKRFKQLMGMSPSAFRAQIKP